jgi:hypothetical protein
MKIKIATALILSFALIACDKTQTESKKLSQVQLMDLKEKCAKVGREFTASYQRSNYDKDNLWDEAEYHYSPKLNTCLAHERYVRFIVNGRLSAHYNAVIDVFTNKPILYGYFTRDTKDKTETVVETGDGNVLNVTSTEYFKRKNQLFSE